MEDSNGTVSVLLESCITLDKRSLILSCMIDPVVFVQAHCFEPGQHINVVDIEKKSCTRILNTEHDRKGD